MEQYNSTGKVKKNLIISNNGLWYLHRYYFVTPSHNQLCFLIWKEKKRKGRKRNLGCSHLTYLCLSSLILTNKQTNKKYNSSYFLKTKNLIIVIF